MSLTPWRPIPRVLVFPTRFCHHVPLVKCMVLSVNGEKRDVPEGATVADLIASLDLHPRRVAVERNKKLVPRARHAETPLADGDVIEIVTLVGGG